MVRALAIAALFATLSITATPGVAAESGILSFGRGYLGLAKGPFGRNEQSMINRVMNESRELSSDLDLDIGTRMRIESLEPVRVVIAKDGFSEDIIRNAVVLVEGDLKAKLIQNSVIIVLGKVSANDIRGSIVAAEGSISAYHIGGRDQQSLVMSKEQILLHAAYSATILAERGAKVQSPTQLTAINTKVRTPHPTRVKYQYTDKDVLSGFSGFFSANF